MSGVRVPLRPRSQKDHARVCKWLKRLASHASTVRFRGFDSHPVYVTADAVALIESPTAGAVLPEKLMLRGAKLHFGQKVSWRSRVGDQALSTSVCLVSSVVELLPCKQSTSVRFRYEARVEHCSTLPCWRNLGRRAGFRLRCLRACGFESHAGYAAKLLW